MNNNGIVAEKAQEGLSIAFAQLKDLLEKPLKWCFEFIFYDTLKDKIEGLIYRLCLAFFIWLAIKMCKMLYCWFCENILNQ